MAWFRDWWAGERYAALTARIGQTDRAIAEHEKALANDSGDAAARLMLAYLYGAKGEHGKAQALWSAMAGPEKVGLAAAPDRRGPGTTAP